MPTKAEGGGNMKGYNKQQKKKKSTSKKSKKSALVSLDLKDDFDENERLLRQFDMDMIYGPCLGMTRLARWQCVISLDSWQ